MYLLLQSGAGHRAGPPGRHVPALMHCPASLLLRPGVSQTVKPGSKRKRRLDLKMDLSSTNCKGCFQELVQLDKAQLEVPLLYCTAWMPHGCDVPQQTTQNAVL